jgi:hypothetical protein
LLLVLHHVIIDYNYVLSYLLLYIGVINGEIMSNDTAFAIIILAMVIAILGAPFAWNEYNKWIDHDKINRNFRDLLGEKDPTIDQETITPVIQKPASNWIFNYLHGEKDPTIDQEITTQVIYTPAPSSFPTIQRNITDGFWCRDK